mmetsp:Transcript_1669/g.4139  ORF Transcript_1669/g.4139 Transcript_1669/m.4139 type:complete len:116 (-) Transcript_1669:61-408(-)
MQHSSPAWIGLTARISDSATPSLRLVSNLTQFGLHAWLNISEAKYRPLHSGLANDARRQVVSRRNRAASQQFVLSKKPSTPHDLPMHPGNKPSNKRGPESRKKTLVTRAFSPTTR